MRTRLTLRGTSGSACDVEVRGPFGTTVGDVRTHLRSAVRASRRHAQPDDADNSPSLWSGTHPLPDAALLGGPGLRSGSALGVDRPGRPDLVARAILRLHVVGGPDAGMVWALPRGTATVGRGVDCDIRLTDANCSRRHVELAVTVAGVSVRDLGSTNGTSMLSDDGSDPVPVNDTAKPLAIGQHVAVGESILSVATVTTPAAVTSTAQDGSQLVNRPPRLGRAGPAPEILLPEPAASATVVALPWLAALVPAVAGGALAWVMHSMQFLAFMLLSPLLLLATGIGERVTGRRGRRHARRHHREREEHALHDVAAAARAETFLRREAHPDPAELLHIATTPSARVWERQRKDADFLDVRVGLADRPAWLIVRRGELAIPPRTLRSVPVWMNLREGGLGLCGPRTLTLGVARWTLTQLLTLHSPADLHLAAILDDDASAWSWLRWVPHLAGGPGGPSAVLARSPEQRSALVARLLAALDAATDGRQAAWAGPWTVLLIDRGADPADAPGLGRLLAQGARVGIAVICLKDEQRQLPPDCASVVRLGGETGTRVHIRVTSARGRTEVPPTDADVLADRVSPAYADRVARALAPLADPGSDTGSALPTAVRLRDLLDLSDLTGATLAARWAANGGRAHTPLGISTEGTFDVDLSRDGPHMLVAGTTGAGKSELLQSIVAGLAVCCSPQDLQFVLIDYKGGAAFTDCARLPHTAGLVTDLDGHLTGRALRSLEAELKRREALFARAGAPDLNAYRSSDAHRERPLGRLVLVVDEFAALAEELPDFLTGLVGIAQRGRSLGVHLILATQRPAGVISPEIRANVAMRIALRVTDAGESRDVIGSEDAAHIPKSLPGRAVVAVGAALTPVQIGRIAVPVDVDADRIEVVPLDDWGFASADAPIRADAAVTDLQVVVSALCDAARTQGRPRPRRPWLPPLEAVLDAAVLADPSRADSLIAVGLRDVPSDQAHRPVLMDLSAGQTMLVAGGARSGRTTVLRTIAALAADALAVADLHVYAIDSAAGGLRALIGLPHCGAVVGRNAPASIARLVHRLVAEIERRAQLLAELGVGTLAEARAVGVVMPSMLLLLDGWEAFVDAVEDLDSGRVVDAALALLRDGAAVGLICIVAGDRGVLTTRLSSAMSQRFVLRMTDSADFTAAGIHRDAVPTDMPPGRAVDAVDQTVVQFAVLGADPSTARQNALLADIVRRAVLREEHAQPGPRPFLLRALPMSIRLVDLPSGRRSAGAAKPVGAGAAPAADVTTSPVAAGEFGAPHGGTGQVNAGTVWLGVGGDAAEPVGVRLFGRSGGNDARMLIAGPPRSGRSTVLQLIAAQLDGQATTEELEMVCFAGPRSGLRRWAQGRGRPVLSPDDRADVSAQRAVQPPLSTGRATVVLLDDCESFVDSPVGDWLTDLIRAEHPRLAVVVSGRSDETVLAFRGIAAEVRRARTGVLLQPGPSDGDLFGISLPLRSPSMPVGRGLLVAAGMTFGAGMTGAGMTIGAVTASAIDGLPDATDDAHPITVQIARP